MDWFRWHHGTVTDPKFRWLAKKSNVSISDVVAIWCCVLENVSMSNKRGELSGFDCADIDVLYDLEDGTCERVLSAMHEKGMIVDNCVAKWSVRQPLREDSTSAERKRRQRDNAATIDMSRNVTQCHAEDVDVPLCPALSQNVPPRLDKIRIEEKDLCDGKARRVRVPKTDHSFFSSWWCYAFECVTGYKYAYDSKDAGVVRNLLATFDGDLKQAVARASRLLISDEEFYIDKKTLGMLAGCINQLPPIGNGELAKCRGYGILPPDGVKLADWKFWENNDDQP